MLKKQQLINTWRVEYIIIMMIQYNKRLFSIRISLLQVRYHKKLELTFRNKAYSENEYLLHRLHCFN